MKLNFKKFNRFRLKIYIRLYNDLYKAISGLTLKINDGVSPKHRLMKYYQFFIRNIDEGSKVLDIGCGNGYLTHKISKVAGKVVGIDFNKQNLAFARQYFSNNNIKFIYSNVLNYNFDENFDYVVLSNVLEHIKDRKKLLLKINHITKNVLIRVPMINRSWLTLYIKELGLDYRLDSTHYIEYTLESLIEELESAKFELEFYEIKFGEIWAKIKSI